MKCLGVDLGSSSIKAAVLDLERASLGAIHSVASPQPISGLPAGHFELSLGEVVAAVRALLEKLMGDQPGAEAVFLSTQMGGVVLVDEAMRPLTPYLSWRDQRTLTPGRSGGSTLDEMRQRITPRQLAEAGQELKAGSATSLLYWLRDQGQLPEGATPLTLGSYVAATLCGASPCVEPTEAIGTLHVASGDWHWDLFTTLGLDRLRWPRLQTYRRPVGAMQLGGRELPCHPAVGDHPCSLLGVGLSLRELSINVSTGSQVSLLTDAVQLGGWQTRRSFDGQFLNTITHLPAGRSLNALVQLVTELGSPRLPDPWPAIVAAVERTSASELAVELTFFDGPLGRTGAIRQITVDNLTVGGLFRAAFRNMAANYRTCAERLAEAGTWDRVVLSGGLTQRVPPLRRFLQECFDCPIRECPEGEDALLGLSRLAQRTYGPRAAS